jgi:DNA-binding IscR family transcriptional regulator
MSNSNRFAVAIHILTLIELRKDEIVTSNSIARSVNTNPVVIRKIMGMLKKAKLIHVQPGVAGAKLAKSLSEITLLDVYNAVYDDKEMEVFAIHKNPNSQCIVSQNIQKTIASLFEVAQNALIKELKQITIEDVVNGVVEKNPLINGTQEML